MNARRMASQLSRGLRLRPPPLGLVALDALRAKAEAALPAAWTRPLPQTFGRIGDLEVRLAATRGDVKRAQRLRYEVFYEEMSARASFVAEMRRRDKDLYDAICDHLLVVDLAQPAEAAAWTHARKPKVVGTYRVLRQDVARHHLGFYSQSEYDIAPLLARMPNRTFVELGRSCVLKPYRTKRAVELLWHGLWTYVRQHRADVMIGCASLPGADAAKHADVLSYLHHVARAPDEWRCRAHAGQYVPMDTVPMDRIDVKSVLRTLPPLIKAYIRLGAYIGDGAVVDHQFGTTDVLIVLPMERIEPRYFAHFGQPDELRSRVALDA